MAQRSWLLAASDEEWDLVRKAALVEEFKAVLGGKAASVMDVDRKLLEEGLESECPAWRKMAGLN
jgi:hypothetical protein